MALLAWLVACKLYITVLCSKVIIEHSMKELTSAIVHLAAFAIGTLKFLADFLKTRLPYLSAFQALMSAKSPVMASSMM